MKLKGILNILQMHFQHFLHINLVVQLSVVVNDDSTLN